MKKSFFLLSATICLTLACYGQGFIVGQHYMGFSEYKIIQIEDSVFSSKNDPFFFEAARSGNAAFLSSELNRLTVDIRNEHGITALMIASFYGYVDLVKVLLNQGANVNLKENTGDWTPLLLASAKKHFDIVDLLIKHGADVNAKNKFGWTSLMFLSHSGQITINIVEPDSSNIKSVELLIEKGANINAKNIAGKTASDIAYYAGYVEIMRIILDSKRKTE